MCRIKHIIILIACVVGMAMGCAKPLIQHNTSILSHSKEVYISQSINLKAGCMTLPDSCRLVFKSGGHVENGTIRGNYITVVSEKKKEIFAPDIILDGKNWTAQTAYSEWFGARDDCKLGSKGIYISGTNNFQAFQNLFLFDNVSVKKGCYYVSGALGTIRSNQTIEGNNAIIKGAFKNKYAGILTVGFDKQSLGISKNIVIRNLTLIGVKEETKVETEWGHGLVIKNAENVSVENLKSKKCKGDGFNIKESFEDNKINVPRYITINNCVSESNYRCGLSITGGEHIKIVNSVFSYTKGTNPQAGVDIEPNCYSGLAGKKQASICKDVLFQNCKFNENSKYGIKIDVHEGVDDDVDYPVCQISINNCRFNGNHISVWRISGCSISNCRITSYGKTNGIVFQNENQENVHVENIKICNTSNSGSSASGIYMSPGHHRKRFVFKNIEIEGAFKYGVYIPSVIAGSAIDDVLFDNINIKKDHTVFRVGTGVKNIKFSNNIPKIVK